MSESSDFLNLLASFLPNDREISSLLARKDVLSSSLQSLALHLALAWREEPDMAVAIGFPTLYDVQKFSDCLTDFIPDESVFVFPKDEILRLGGAASSREMAKERLKALGALLAKRPGIYLFNAVSALTRLEKPEDFRKFCLTVSKGMTLDRHDLIDVLAKDGYLRVDWVNAAFEFASRGAIVDAFLPGYDLPVRFEFDDEMVDDIRLFSPNTLEGTKELTAVTILPASERPLTKEQAQAGKDAIDKAIAQKRADGVKSVVFNLKANEAIQAADGILNTLNVDEADERYFGYYPVEKTNLYSYLKNTSLYIVDSHEFQETQAQLKSDERLYFQGLMEHSQALPEEGIYDDPVAIQNDASFSKIEINRIEAEDNVEEVVASNRSLSESAQLFTAESNANLTVFACVEKRTVPNLIAYLQSAAMPYALYPERSSKVTIIPHPLTQGFRLAGKASFLSSEEIYGLALRRSRFLSKYKEFHPIKKYSDLKPGDYVVEENNGIGIYRGLAVKNGQDSLLIEYANKQILSVPVFQFGKIRKYAGSEAAKPSLDVLGGSTWARRKAKIKSRMSYLADRLLNIYAERASAPGIAFVRDAEVEREFTDKFPYPLTDSQIKAWNAISEDMEKPHPMDRLLAGDVGFGKTEVAFKAIFRAIENGYQAALLCPTTVLARQHYESALKRFEGFGIQIGSMSRYASSKENQALLKGLADGSVDLVIGTHRLLSSDVKFKKLGVLVVDEEQRFGVAQKERIKEIAKNVDVLSLSATPIPRTLQMSLLTIKPMSTLEEAPSNRVPVKTYVVKENEGLIKEVIARELARHGQVYFLHNRIDSIYKRAGDLQKMFPSAKIAVAHGRLSPQDMSDVMNDFYDGNLDILVCTSIIESGLDVPNVNTIIIEDAQNFGLAELYQIKGRVGRSDRMAYAYLFYRDYAKLTEEGQQRLKAIKDFTELGSGYKIAQQDLAIRGAGDILGKEQAGFVDSLGYEAYTQLLNEVIRQKRYQETGVKAAIHPKATRYLLSFTLEAKIPDEYAPESDRINLYREFADCTDFASLAALAKRIKDAYGPLPQEVENLIAKRSIEILLNDSKVFDSFDEGMETFKITLSKDYSNVPNIAKTTETVLAPLAQSVQSVRFQDRKFVFVLRRTADYLNDLLYLCKQVTNAFYQKPING